MTGEEEDGGESALIGLMSGGFVLGLVGQLQATYPSAATGLIEDAVAEAARRLVERLRKQPPVIDVAAYFAKVAHNLVKQWAKRAAEREAPLDHRPDIPHASAEDEALRHAAVELIRAETRTWTNTNIREVMLVYLESIAYGEPLEAAEVAEIVGQNVGEEISAGSVRVWKARGLRRLQDFVAQAEFFQRVGNNCEKEKDDHH